MTDENKLKQKFWTALGDSPFLFLQRQGASETAVPMTAQLDRQAHHAIWFFTSRNTEFAPGTPVTATFTARNHDLFARFGGQLSEETDKARFDEEWSPAIQAWFPQGKEDPNLVMLRMDLGEAEIWDADLGFIETAKMMLGFDVRNEMADDHVKTAL